MCGIAGMITGSGVLDEVDVRRARDVLSHRGPDDAGVWIGDAGRVALAHRRLSIIDLSPAGHQPMCNEDASVWLVFNGEIYNFQSLRFELARAGHAFRSNSDTEVIIHAYEEWGPGCVKRLRGMFAFALWDQRTRQLLLARDRLGIKPLFYWWFDDNLTFASELKGVLADSRVGRRIDETAAYDFFTYRYVPTPKTIFRDVRKLPPGYYALFHDGRLCLHEYWDVPFGASRAIGEQDATEALLAKLQESVDLHLIADVPVGVMLSGGLDSSSISALAAGSTRGRLHTFSIGFDVAQHDERAFARMVVERYGTEHSELEVTRDMAMSMRDEIVRLYDEPFADSSAIPTLYVSKLARSKVKVALSGEGGDELFGGYSWYSHALRLSRADCMPIMARKLAAAWLERLRSGVRGAWTVRMTSLDPIERYTKLLGGFLRSEKAARLSPAFTKRFDGYDDYWYFRKHWRQDLDPWSRMQYLDMKTYLNDDILTKVDRASMAVSLEARVPLLDHELIETVLAFPTTVRNRNSEQKYLLKKAVRDYLPEPLLTRKKRGFSIPLYEWLKAPTIDDLGPIYDGMFNMDQIFGRDKSSDGIAGSDIWPVIVMNRWLCAHA